MHICANNSRICWELSEFCFCMDIVYLWTPYGKVCKCMQRVSRALTGTTRCPSEREREGGRVIFVDLIFCVYSLLFSIWFCKRNQSIKLKRTMIIFNYPLKYGPPLVYKYNIYGIHQFLTFHIYWGICKRACQLCRFSQQSKLRIFENDSNYILLHKCTKSVPIYLSIHLFIYLHLH